MTLSPPPSNYHNHPIPLPLYSQQIPKRHPFTKRAVETSFPIFDNAILKSARGGKRNRKRQEEDDEEEEEIGGFPYGIISSISGGNSCGKTLIAMHTITSHLLANPESHVAWVDTDGNFSAQRLLEIVALQLSQQQQTKSEKPISRQELLQQAGKVLDRVQITKAFDMDAVMQSLEEIKMNMEEWEKEKEKKDEEARKEKLKVIRSSVDSEDEIAEDEQETKNAGGAKEGSEVGEVGGDAVMDGRVGVLVIDTISTLSERVRLKKQIAADSILTTFSRTTALLAKNWSIAVLLLDTPPISNTQQLPQQQQHSYQPSKSTSDSIFAEIKQSPSLGPVLEFAVDFKVMLSHFDGLLEGGKEAQPGRRQQQQRRGGVEPIIFEVVSDRQGSRRGNWMVYAIKQNGYEVIEFPWPQKEQGPPVKMRSAFRGGLE